MLTVTANVPRGAGRQTSNENVWGCCDCSSAVPNWVVGIGAGSVTAGAAKPDESLNCVVMLVTKTIAEPVGVTVTMSGTLKGVATGQPRGGTAGLDASAVAVIDTDEADMGGVFVVGLTGPELHDETNNAAASSSGSLASRSMGNLRPQLSKLFARGNEEGWL